MKTVSDVEEVRKSLLHIFPDAIRGSVARCRWGRGRKELHLSYWVGSDTVGGKMIVAKGGLLYFVEWNTNEGHTQVFAESENDKMVKRVSEMFKSQHRIERCVG
jgi:hypothetical protein